VNGGRELAHDIIKKSEKDTHDARAEAKRPEEDAEHERRICIIFWFSSFGTCFVASNLSILPTSAELSPLPEPYDPLADLEMKEAVDIINMADSIIDEVDDKLFKRS
jgi:hypothetical protein